MEETNSVRTQILGTVMKICEEQEKQNGMRVSRRAMAALTELTITFSDSLSKDMQMFAKHAKRTTINKDDVLLCARRNPDLVERMQKKLEDLRSQNKNPKKRKIAESKEDENTVEDLVEGSSRENGDLDE